METHSHDQQPFRFRFEKEQSSLAGSIVCLAPPASPKSKRKHVGGYFELEVARLLRMLASEEDTTVQELLTEALRLIFAKRGLSVL